MLKKLCFALVFIMIFLISGIPALAAVDIYSSDTPGTAQTILTITRPEVNENTYNQSFEICGFTDKERVHVEFLIFNEKKDVYEKLYDVNEENSWDDIGVFFAKEVKLQTGINKIRIVAYTKVAPEKKQISDFRIMVIEDNIVNKIRNGIIDILRLSNGFWGNK